MKNTTVTYKTLSEAYSFNLPEIYNAFMDFCNVESLEGIAQIVEPWGIQIDPKQEVSDDTYNVLSTVMTNAITLIDFYSKIPFKTRRVKDSLGLELVGIFTLIVNLLTE